MASPDFPLVEERDAEFFNVNNSQRPIRRKGLFLNPTSSSLSFPNRNGDAENAAVYAAIDEHKCCTYFRWWADPDPQWGIWVNALRPRYSHLWKKAGIFDAIMDSKFKIRRDSPSLLGASRFWSEQTNTFIFPWAEATITLEDVMILGEFSVLGEPVRAKEPLEDVIGQVVSKMMTELEHFKRICPTADQLPWMTHYIGRGNGDEIEHIAFLSLWLSRFVLITGDGGTIGECVLQVAVRLARGTRIALAPAVLASIYRELRTVKENLYMNRKSWYPLCAPMNIVQLWLRKRFLRLRIGSHLPRAVFVMKVLDDPCNFQWEPYVDEWKKKRENSDEVFQSFAKCLRACELVGLDCIEQYQPHRVALQFGLDQDIPNFIPRVNDTWEVAWKTYDITLKNMELCVPLGFTRGEVTIQYSNWWRNMKNKRKEAHDLSGNKNKRMKGFGDIEFSDFPAIRPHGTSGAFAMQRREELGQVSADEEAITGAITKTSYGGVHHDAKESDAIAERAFNRRGALERDMRIERLKEEISSMEEKMRYLESLAEAQSKLQ